MKSIYLIIWYYREGFDPYKDTVGPGIYGGIVKRDESGEVGGHNDGDRDDTGDCDDDDDAGDIGDGKGLLARWGWWGR